MHRAYSLIEYLLCLAITPLLMLVLNQTLERSYMLLAEAPRIKQNTVFELQVQQLLIRSRRVKCEANRIYFERNNLVNEISFNGKYIIKKPGYEILLHNVTDFSCEGSRVTYTFEAKEYEFYGW